MDCRKVCCQKERDITLFFDIVGEGICGLYNAARTYDLRHGEKKGHRQATFKGHAKSHIKRRIEQYLEALRNVCYVPRSKQTAAFKAATRRMEQQGKDVTKKTYYEFLANPSNGLKQKTMETLRVMWPEIVDAFFTLRSAKRCRFGSTAKDERLNPAHYVADKSQPYRRSIDDREIDERMRRAVESLSPAQREVIQLRYLDANLEQEEIGAVRGISHQSVSCTEKKAMEVLKEKLKDLEEVVA